jgi:hypothetical protein
VRVWRTSHTGGHRFAPTAVVLPQGTAWAFCDRAALARIAQRNGPMDDLLPRYRGCSGMRSQAIQALERAVLSEVGWRLLDMARWGADLGGDRIELVVEDSSGERAVWEAHVRDAPRAGLPPAARACDEERGSVGRGRLAAPIEPLSDGRGDAPEGLRGRGAGRTSGALV